MNRLAMIAATGFLAVFLTACGDNSKPADDKATDTTVQQPQTTGDDAGKTDTGAAQPSTEGQGQ